LNGYFPLHDDYLKDAITRENAIKPLIKKGYSKENKVTIF
jgi:hypothetical protein